MNKVFQERVTFNFLFFLKKKKKVINLLFRIKKLILKKIRELYILMESFAHVFTRTALSYISV